MPLEVLSMRYLIETSNVNVRMVHHERAFSFGDKSGLLDEYGFLRNPRWVQGLKTLEDVANERGAVIVAESGLGKSHIAREFARRKGRDAVLFVDVQEYRGASHELLDAIRSAHDKQYVCLDGLDEAPELAGSIARGMGALSPSVKRLIFSRGVPELRQFTDNGGLPMYSLLPLTQEGVKALAKEAGVDGKAFLAEVMRKNLGPACAKPLECEALLEMFRGENCLKGNNDELRKRTILHLCAENGKNPNRYSSSATVSAETCFLYAKKIALILKLSGLSVIKRMDEMEAAPGTVNFTRYGDLFDAHQFNRILLRGLFLPIGEDRFRFAHIAYFDYLAAQGLVENVAQKNWREILMNGDGLVYPQWENAVAWVAAKDDGVFNAVFARQPELLLNSDAAVSRKGPAELCRAVLPRAAHMDYWSRQSSGIVLQFAKLISPDSVEVLREALWGKEESCREMAIDVIKRCAVRELIPDLINLFCSEDAPLGVRKGAGYALLWMNVTATEAKGCKAVLKQSGCTQDLKGLLFRMTWPFELSAKEMTPHLTLKKNSIGDSYSMWISGECARRFEKMSQDDALEMLRWAARGVDKDDDSIHPIRELKSQVFTYCFKRAATDEMYNALAEVYESFCEKHKSPICPKHDYEEYEVWMCTDDEFKGLVSNRRRLAEAVIRRGHADAALWVSGWVCELLGPTDVDFLEGKLRTEKDADVLLRWAQCLGRLQWCIQLPECAEYWESLHKRFPDVFRCTARKALAERVRFKKSNDRRRLKQQAEERACEHKRQVAYESSLKTIRRQIKAGDILKSFYGFVVYCSHQSCGEGKDNTWGFHICNSRVWGDLSEIERRQLVMAAEEFLKSAQTPRYKSGQELYPAIFASFVLLYEMAHERFMELPENLWRKFRDEVLQGCRMDDSPISLEVAEYFRTVYRENFIQSVLSYLKSQKAIAEKSEPKHLYIGDLKRALKGDDLLCREILDRLDAREWPDAQRFELLDAFWDVSPDGVLSYLKTDKFYLGLDLLSHPATAIFALYACPDRFKKLLGLLEKRGRAAKNWIIKVVGRESYWNSSLGYLLRMLSTEDLARFYLVIRKHFPLKDAPDHPGCFTPDAIDSIYTFDSQLISRIYERKGQELVPVLEKLVRTLPEEQFLRDHLIRARKEVLAEQCPTYDVRNIRLMLDEKNQAFLVNTPEALCNVVIAALGQYQMRLTGKRTPRAKLLWNCPKGSKGLLTHKDEEDFSDDICDHLDLTLKPLIFNREVQLNRGRRGVSGSRTDIWVDAIASEGSGRLSLCIEVKGSWNRSARKAIKKQLVLKYMGTGGADAGILALGWFDAPAPYQSHNQWRDIEAAKKDLEAQATVERMNGYVVSSVTLDCRF